LYDSYLIGGRLAPRLRHLLRSYATYYNGSHAPFSQQGRAVVANSTCRWSDFAHAVPRPTSSPVCASLISDGHSYGEPDKVTAVMEFLLSDDASFVTSSLYTVDGGTMWL
jgi:NAD(P)-dependent dehydrogenase (short-subunit alcohol dehydrogenase family)